MALAVVSVRLTGAGSCGIHRASFRSGSGALALASMAPIHRGALTLQAGAIGLTCKVVGPGRRMVVESGAGAAGLHGGDAPLDPKATLTQQLKSVTERTLRMLRELRTPTNGGAHPVCDQLSVALELGELRAECQGLVEELAAGSVPDRAASIMLLGFHARVDVLIELFYGNHASLEESTKSRLLNYMAQTEHCLQEQGIRGPATEEVAAETSVPNLLKTLANKTITLLAGVSEFYLSKDVTLPDRISVSPELNELRDRCGQLIEEVTAGAVADHVAVGTLLGLHARFRIVFLFCIRAADHPSRPDCLDSRISAALATSLTDAEQRVKHYVEKEEDAAEEVE